MKIADFNFAGKKAIVRVDFNVPLDENGKVTDDTRIRGALPTLKKVLADGGALIMMSHMGKPKGKVNEKLSLSQIVPNVSAALGVEVKFAKDCGNASEEAAALKPGEALLLENLRFYPEEEGKPVGVEKGTPEYDAIMGGSKVSTKIGIIENLLTKVDNLILCGGMTYTFAKAQGGHIGLSICEDDKLDVALDVIKKAKENGVNLVLGTDSVCGDAFKNDCNTQVCPSGAIPEGWEGMDAGPETRKLFANAIKGAKTILWNGPAGVFEFDNFAGGSKAIAEAIAEATKEGAFSLIGGGDSVACINKFGLADQVSYISTGGGALLEAIEGKVLPGVAAIEA